MKTLILGSTVLDMVIRVERLPNMQEDINTKSLKLTLGGMAFNVYQILNEFQCDSVLGSAIGTGMFADIVEKLLKEKGIAPFVKIQEQDNGCCMCFVDKSNDRTFVAHHGAEYKFDEKWYENLNFNEFDMIYVSGLEIEEDTGIEMVNFLVQKNRPIFFAPGPRLLSIDKFIFKKILSITKILHLNEQEAKQLSGCEDIKESGYQLHRQHGCNVVITMGEKGAYLFENEICEVIDGVKANVQDTIGAGDSHAGGILSGLSMNMSLKNAVVFANHIASKVVEIEGTDISFASFEKIKEDFR